jgi:LmbE family N-acetylglucosaminyl deacetylase/CheY-like chemotaxis protein
VTEPYRILLVDRDLDALARLKAELEIATGGPVMVTDPHYLRATVAKLMPDVVLAAASSMELIPGVRDERPGIPVVIMTSTPTLDDAVRAVRNGATEFLPEIPPTPLLAARLVELAAAYRGGASGARRRQTVLAIGAHPDDVETGIGGILAAHRAMGDELTILTLSKGRREGGVEVAWAEGSAAAAIVGARLVLEDHLHDGFAGVLAAIGAVVEAVEPTIVYTHSKNDRRQDHRVVHEATVTACEEVPTVACYHGTTGTIEFAPTRFVPIDGFTEAKLAMLACFATRGERPEYLSPDFALASARYWSQYGQGSFCEPLEIIRESLLSPVAPALAPTASHAYETGAIRVSA